MDHVYCCIVLYCIVLYCIVLYCIVLCDAAHKSIDEEGAARMRSLNRMYLVCPDSWLAFKAILKENVMLLLNVNHTENNNKHFAR